MDEKRKNKKNIRLIRFMIRMILSLAAAAMLSGCALTEIIGEEAESLSRDIPGLEDIPSLEDIKEMLLPDLDFSFSGLIPEEIRELWYVITDDEEAGTGTQPAETAEDTEDETEEETGGGGDTPDAEDPPAEKDKKELPKDITGPAAYGSVPSGEKRITAWLSKERYTSSDGIYAFFASEDFTSGGYIETEKGNVVKHEGRLTGTGSRIIKQGGTEMTLTTYRLEEADGRTARLSFAEYGDKNGILEIESSGGLMVLEKSEYAKEYTENWLNAIESKISVQTEPAEGSLEPPAEHSTEPYIITGKAGRHESKQDSVRVDVLRMPDVRRKDLHSAVQELQEYGVRIDVWEVPSPEPQGRVIEQNLPGGVRLFDGDEIILVVSGGNGAF